MRHNGCFRCSEQYASENKSNLQVISAPLPSHRQLAPFQAFQWLAEGELIDKLNPQELGIPVEFL